MENYNRYIYKIKCLCGDYKGYFYIGQRSTSLPIEQDDYAGSGIRINNYYDIYGKKKDITYRKTILKSNIANQTKLDYYEKKFIEKYLGNRKCLNIDEGGLHKDGKSKESHDYYNDGEKLISCKYDASPKFDNILKHHKYDSITEQLIKDLKRDPHNWAIRQKLCDCLFKYCTGPSIIMYEK